MNKYPITSFYFLFVFLFSCNNSGKINDVDNSNSDSIRVDVSDIAESIEYSKIFAKIEYIPLETSPNCIIGGIDKMIRHENRFFILDQQTLSLFIFDAEGKFLNKISQFGKGPQEYASLSDFFLDIDHNRIILNCGTKFLYFDMNTCTFIKEERKAKNSQSAYLGNETFAYYSRNSTWNGKYNISAYRQGKEIYRHLPISEKMAGFTFEKEYSFFQPDREGNVLFATMLDNVVYKLNPDSMAVAYHIDFGKNGLPENFLDDVPHDERIERLFKSSYCRSVDNFIKNDYLTFFNFTYKERVNTYLNLHERKEKFIFQNDINDMTFIGDISPFLYCDDVSIYSWMQMVDFKEEYPIIKENENLLDAFEKEAENVQYKEKIDDYRKTLLTIKEQLKAIAERSDEDNPVMIRFYYR